MDFTISLFYIIKIPSKRLSALSTNTFACVGYHAIFSLHAYAIRCPSTSFDTGRRVVDPSLIEGAVPISSSSATRPVWQLLDGGYTIQAPNGALRRYGVWHKENVILLCGGLAGCCVRIILRIVRARLSRECMY